MSKQTINIGASPNDGTGTPLRTSFDYTNQNFTELYTALGGGVGLPGSANQIIFNNGSSLAGDADLFWNSTLNFLTVTGSAIITADLTVDGGTLKVDSTNNFVGINKTPTVALDVSGSATITGDLTAARLIVTGGTIPTNGLWLATTNTLEFAANSLAQYRIAPLGVFSWYDGAGGTRMTLNANGLGIGISPVYKFHAAVTSGAVGAFRATTAAIARLLVGNTVEDVELKVNANGDGQLTANASKYLGLGSGGINDRVVLDASGNLGISVTPSTWSGTFKMFETLGGSFGTNSNGALYIPQNATFNAGWLYKNTLPASYYAQSGGAHQFFNAPSGTAGNAITFTQSMTLDASGNLGIGVTTPVYKLDTYTRLQGAVGEKRFANRTSNKIIVKRYFGILADTALFSIECGTAGTAAMAAFEINVFATGQKSGSSSDRQFYGKWYVTRNLAGTFTITSAFSSGSSGAFTVTASGTSLNVNGIFSVISDGSACVEITGYIGGRDTVDETNLTVTMP